MAYISFDTCATHATHTHSIPETPRYMRNDDIKLCTLTHKVHSFVHSLRANAILWHVIHIALTEMKFEIYCAHFNIIIHFICYFIFFNYDPKHTHDYMLSLK